MSSLKTNQEIFMSPWGLPDSLQWINYVNAWINSGMSVYATNSVIISLFALFLTISTGSMAAYVLSRFKFKGNKICMMLFISGLAIPIELLAIPIYIMFINLNLVNTRFGLIMVYTAVGLPFTIFILAGFMRTIPHEIEEAATIDGCAHWGIYWHIILPLSMPGIISVSIFNFLRVWNEYFLALLLITDDAKMPLSLGLYNLQVSSQNACEWGTLFAGAVIVIIPTLLVYVILRNRITSGLTVGALK